jgi:hypothetical protein
MPPRRDDPCSDQDDQARPGHDGPRRTRRGRLILVAEQHELLGHERVQPHEPSADEGRTDPRRHIVPHGHPATLYR